MQCLFQIFFLSFHHPTLFLMEGYPGVLFVADDTRVKYHTTHSSSFLGLNNTRSGLWKRTRGANMIIGVLDTGEESELSFFWWKIDTQGMPSGRCLAGRCELCRQEFWCSAWKIQWNLWRWRWWLYLQQVRTYIHFRPVHYWLKQNKCFEKLLFSF